MLFEVETIDNSLSVYFQLKKSKNKFNIDDIEKNNEFLTVFKKV